METFKWYWRCPECKKIEYCEQEEARKLADEHAFSVHNCKNVYQIKTIFGWEKVNTNTNSP